MRNKIRILLVEHDEIDFVLIREMLRQGGLDFTLHRVENEMDFVNALMQQPADIILSDHGIPPFDSFRALELARRLCPEVPFIFITGAMGEDGAITSLPNGATNPVFENRLPQLPQAVKLAWREVEASLARRQLEQDHDQLSKELKAALIEINPLTGPLPVCGLCQRIQDHQDGWRPMEAYLQTHPDTLLTHEFCPECETKISPILFHRGQVYTEFRSGQ